VECANLIAVGGVVYLDGSSSVEVLSVDATHNTATNFGGFGCFFNAEFSISESTISSNGALLGGAIYLDVANASVPSLDHITFLSNTAESGGVIFWRVNSASN
jgi:hypothetical protein